MAEEQETTEQKMAQLREDLLQQQVGSQTLLGIVKSIDAKVDELTGLVRATQIESTIVETRLSTIDRRLDAMRLERSALEGRIMALLNERLPPKP